MKPEKTEILEPQVTEIIQKTEMESLIDKANRYPRDIMRVKANVLLYATVDQETAKKCFYAKPVDDKGTIVNGPSIRLAEIIKNLYKNMSTAVRSEEPGQKFVKVQAMARDLENNIYHSVEITKSIWSERQRRRYSQNMIETTIRAGQALALRDAIFKVIPINIFSTEMKEIERVGSGAKSETPLIERVEHLIIFLEKEGVTAKRVLARMEVKSIAAITEDMFTIVMGLGNAVADGETTYEEAFPMTNDAEDTAQTLTTDLKEVIASKIKSDASEC